LLARYSGNGHGRVVVDGTRRGAPVSFSTNVDFPDRDRQNAFVARLWAAQRVGFLSAEKRKNGGSSELDDEIRMLGERYGIPTEFTSYLVTEPQLAMNRQGDMRRDMPRLASAPMPVAEMRFESAKAASAQRAASSLVTLDSLALAKPVVSQAGLKDGQSMSTRLVGGHTFVLRDAVWTDARYSPTMPTTKVKPFSKAYFDLIAALPELRATFALGDRVIVVGRGRAISMSDDGVSELSPSALATLVKAW
jgi:Ca-activated chloride channel family protein